MPKGNDLIGCAEEKSQGLAPVELSTSWRGEERLEQACVFIEERAEGAQRI